jgi:hypothetical protein
VDTKVVRDVTLTDLGVVLKPLVAIGSVSLFGLIRLVSQSLAALLAGCWWWRQQRQIRGHFQLDEE